LILDASAALDFLVEEGSRGRWVRQMVAQEAEFAAPHLIDVEVASGLRKALARRDLSERRASDALKDFRDFALTRYPVTGLLQRIWTLRGSLTPYDAAYVALAEALDDALVTTDRRLARSRGHRAEIIAPA
jgi:predicted nucleic acid-binding protein